MMYYHSTKNKNKTKTNTKTKTKTKPKTKRKPKTTKKGMPMKYVPKRLSTKDKKAQRRMLNKSRKMYQRGEYYTRKKVSSFKSKPSKHIRNARRIYNIDKVVPSKALSRKTGCTVAGLNRIVKKGEGAYYSSGSRPNQTARSWGLARLASSVTGGKSAAVDFHIIDKACTHTKKAYRLAKKSKKKHGHGTRKVPKVFTTK